MNPLLEKARQQLELPDPQGPRRACWLARAALEGIVDELLFANGVVADHASERAKLTCLEGVYVRDRDVAHQAEYAWSRLSEACHQHAYQLAPTYAEVRHLVDRVDELETLSQQLGRS